MECKQLLLTVNTPLGLLMRFTFSSYFVVNPFLTKNGLILQMYQDTKYRAHNYATYLAGKKS